MRNFLPLASVAIGLLFSAPAAAQAPRLEGEAGGARLLRLALDDFRSAKKPAFWPVIDVDSASSALAKLCRGEIAGGAVGRSMTAAESSACEKAKVSHIDLPLALDAVVVVVNPRNTWAKELSASQLRRAWADDRTRPRSWSEIDADWPAAALKLYGPTIKVALAEKYAAALGFPDSTALRRDVSTTEVLSLVADAVARDQNALGVLDWGTYSANRQRVRAVPVAFDGERVQSVKGAPKPPAEGPLSYPLRLYLNATAVREPAMKEFLLHLFANAERLSAAAGVRALPASDYQQAAARIKGMP